MKIAKQIYTPDTDNNIIDALESLHDLVNGNISEDNTTAPTSFLAYKASGSQTIANNSWTKVTFVTEEWDDSGYYDAANSKFLPLIKGKYSLKASVLYDSTTTDKEYELSVYKNGTIYKAKTIHSAVGTSNITPSISAIVDANGTTDYFEIFSRQITGVNQNLAASQVQTFFQGFIVR